jgi:predicted signal transduction protein with EAL and GGDEF domain
MVTTAGGKITFANTYFVDALGWDPEKLVCQSLERLLTRASHIFCDCYVFPLLLQEGVCLELQLTCVKPSGERVAVVANARQLPNAQIAWSLFSAVNRNKLFDELAQAHKALEVRKKLLESLSIMDGLTGLMNRRAFDAGIEQAIRDVNRTGRPLALLLLDIDNFKAIPDTFGHSVGDQVLRDLGAVFRQVLRANEVSARYGGEEFGSL